MENIRFYDLHGKPSSYKERCEKRQCDVQRFCSSRLSHVTESLTASFSNNSFFDSSTAPNFLSKQSELLRSISATVRRRYQARAKIRISSAMIERHSQTQTNSFRNSRRSSMSSAHVGGMPQQVAAENEKFVPLPTENEFEVKQARPRRASDVFSKNPRKTSNVTPASREQRGGPFSNETFTENKDKSERRGALVNILQQNVDSSSEYESETDDEYDAILLSHITNKDLGRNQSISQNSSTIRSGGGGVASGSSGGKVTLKIAVADFSKKIQDNEGMDISTFSYLDNVPDDEEAPISMMNTTDENKIDQTVVNNVASVTVTAPTSEPILQENTSSRRRRKKKKKRKELTPAEKFRRGVKTINLLIKACTTSAEQTRKNQKKFMTFSDLTEQMKENEENVSATRGLFDPADYKARTERTLSKEAKQILLIHPSLRSQEQLHIAGTSLCNAVEAFNEFPIFLQKSLVKVGWYEHFGSKRVIIRQGHNALNFYFIISGVTVVTVARQNKSTGESYGETVAFLKKGNSFGELALMYGGKRSATVSCTNDVELLAVSRDDFIDIFMNLNTDVEPDHIIFLRQLPILKGWPIDELPYDDPRICMLTYCRRDTVLCRDSNSADWVYIIMTGYCRIVKDLPAISSAMPKLRIKTRVSEKFPVQLDEREIKYQQFLCEDNGLGNRLLKLNSENSENSKGLRIKPQTFKSKSISGKKIYVQLKILGPKDVFGLEPISFSELGGTTGVTLISDGAEVILISKEFFVRHLSQSYRKLLRYECQPFPTVKSLIDKLQAFYNWDAFKEHYLDHVTFYKKELNNSALF